MSRNRFVARSQQRRSRRASSTEQLDEIRISGSHKRAISSASLHESEAIFELSLDANAPGVLKIFGAALHSGVEYKSILVSHKSTAAQIVVEILDRLAVTSPNAKLKYHLCEVLGRFENDAQLKFVKEHTRVLNENDCVVQLLQGWKPARGLYRRIELQTVLDETEHNAWFVDNETHDLNVNARRFAFTKVSLCDRKALEKSFRYSTSSLASCLTKEVTFQSNETTTMIDKATEILLTSSVTKHDNSIQLPAGPCLLQLKGCDEKKDRLVHQLFNFNVLGRSADCSIVLNASDVHDEHCYILAVREEINSPANLYHMMVQPNLQSVTYLNGNLLETKESLFPGDMLEIGSDCNYMFLYKDSSQIPEHFLQFSWLKALRNNFLSARESNSSRKVCEDILNEDDYSVLSTTLPPDSILDDVSLNESTAIVSFVQDCVKKIFKKYFHTEINLQYCTTLFVMLIHYLIDNGQSDALDELKWQMLETIMTLSKKVQDTFLDHGSKSELQKLVHASALFFEVRLHFCQFTNDHQQQHDALNLKFNWCEFCDTIIHQTQEDLIHILSQDMLEKSYALFLSDPFQQSQGDDNIFSMDQFLTALTNLTSLFIQIEYQSIYTLKKHVIRRLIIMIVHRYVRHILSDVKSFSNWNMGIRLRANFDIFEQWIMDENLQILSDCTELLNDLVNLLATPRSHLITCNWNSLKTFFPALPASLLQSILNGYDEGDGSNVKIWKVSDKDKLEASYEASCALEENMQHLMKHSSLLDRSTSSSVVITNYLENENVQNLLRRLDAESYDKYNGITWVSIWRQQLIDRSCRINCPTAVTGVAEISKKRNRQRNGTMRSLDEEKLRLMVPKTIFVEMESAYFSSSGTSKDSARKEIDQSFDLLNSNLLSFNDTCQPHLHSSVDSISSTDLILKKVSNANHLSSNKNSFMFAKRNHQIEPSRQGSNSSKIKNHCHELSLSSTTDTSIINGNTMVQNAKDTTAVSPSQLFQTSKVNNQLPIGSLKNTFTTALEKDFNNSVGLGIVDGLNTELNESGIFVRSIVPYGPADQDGSIHIGDCILAVNGETLVGKDYRKATELIKQAGHEVQLMISKSDISTALKVIASKC